MSPEHSPQARWFAAEDLPQEADLRACLRRSVPGLSDIDDFVQETYARIFSARAAGRVNEARLHLFTTARNATCDVFRRS